MTYIKFEYRSSDHIISTYIIIIHTPYIYIHTSTYINIHTYIHIQAML